MLLNFHGGAGFLPGVQFSHHQFPDSPPPPPNFPYFTSAPIRVQIGEFCIIILYQNGSFSHICIWQCTTVVKGLCSSMCIFLVEKKSLLLPTLPVQIISLIGIVPYELYDLVFLQRFFKILCKTWLLNRIFFNPNQTGRLIETVRLIEICLKMRLYSTFNRDFSKIFRTVRLIEPVRHIESSE